MIERAIENWLINAIESNYQLPFCQVLLKKGHRIVYVSSHGQMEQGEALSLSMVQGVAASPLSTMSLRACLLDRAGLLTARSNFV